MQQSRKLILLVLISLFTAPFAFCQKEVLKSVVNNLAFYKQKNDLKYLANAKRAIDSLIKTRADSLNLEKNVNRAVVNSSILYIDSLNKLNQPANFFDQTVSLVDKLSLNPKIYRFQPEIDFSKRCLANVYIRKAFVYVNNSDFVNALQLFEKAQKYAPLFKQLNAYIAYSDNKLGNLTEAANYYNKIINDDNSQVEYVETTSNIYEAISDTAKALDVILRGRKIAPNNATLIAAEANIYNIKRDYRHLEPLLPGLLNDNMNNPDIAFVAANCYDHLNNYTKAESLYLHVIELNSSAFDPAFNLGILYLKESVQSKDNNAATLNRAVQWLEKANDMAPNDIKCLQVLQWAYQKTGNINQINNINNKLKQLTN